jgi:chromosome segregation protein|tara:strand:+ start:627 stop:4121 length:3495 start_codon:yes stop_codon:yes gene_type:complete
MKLKQIKLAGFKTFVDPTKIFLGGQLAGIVGPNGCGKSNIMESVKWVLGSSSAKELRGDSMDAVIFSGTDTRQALSRASVELIFDNQLGQAPAEWSSYAEISVKRVIEKDKGSTYLINNSAVRRKDVADLFLGTGLGSKGYAIIGQNTISQIVEAKPEELKSFLEEAAGVSKYKERRKETEYRLRDTKNNLSRVQDLLREINQQISKLESQAQAAKKHNELNENLILTNAQIWVKKKQSTNNYWIKVKEEIEHKTLALEKQTSLLTSIEKSVEETRQEFNNSTDLINSAQASFYEKNSLVSDAENKTLNLKEKIDRQKNIKTINQDKIKKINETEIALKEELANNESLLNENKKKKGSSLEILEKFRDNFQTAKERNEAAVNEHHKSSTQLQASTEKLNISLTSAEFIENNISELNHRINSLEVEFKSLDNDAQNNEKPKDLSLIEVQIKETENLLESKNLKSKDMINKIDKLRNESNIKKSELDDRQVRVSSLKEIIEQEVDQKKIEAWLSEVGFKSHTSLVKSIDIKDGWEKALGLILGSKVEAYKTNDINTNDIKRPPYTITIIHDIKNEILNTNKDLTSSLTLVDSKEATLKNTLTEWLSNIYIAEQDEIAEKRKFLKSGEAIITKSGDIYGRSYQILNQPSNNKDNRLLRIKQLESYEKEIPVLTIEYNKLSGALLDIENRYQELSSEISETTEILKKSNEEKNRLSFEFNKLLNVIEVNNNRKKLIDNEVNKLKENLKEISTNRDDNRSNIEVLKKSLDELNLFNDNTLKNKSSSEKVFFELRDQLSVDEKLLQEIEFNIKLTNNKIIEIQSRLVRLRVEREDLLVQANESINNNINEELIQIELQLKDNIKSKETAELALVKARENLVEKETKLKELETNRLENQHLLNPLNETLQQSKLDEREAKLKFDLCCEEVNKSKYQESEVLADLDEKFSLDDLESKSLKISDKIEKMGPVNLAAISELTTIQERQTYILAQVDDLQNASDTLNNAIRKIDLETREKLKETYKSVNENFTHFFRTLFDGGRAELELLGNEILDTGLQVVAQPPGKKNTTIHLLSGGEKALTAIALVFALFKLNPSPFCLMDEVDAPLDDSNTERFCKMVKEMSLKTQFLFVSHNKLTMEIAEQLIGVTMQEPGVSRIVEVDLQDIENMESVG